jgi:hypothetical protein
MKLVPASNEPETLRMHPANTAHLCGGKSGSILFGLNLVSFG